ncbi:MAG: hypothetical protein IJN92_06880 [Lachnospiraceae bacterium]|nr:hypothetical protein [Lachnospiraceae bacterium]
MSDKKDGIKLIVSIVERGQGKGLIKLFEKNGIGCHYQCSGHGTASSELLDVLGVGTTERDIILSLAADNNAENFLYKLKEEEGFYSHVPLKGLVFYMPLTGLNNILTTILLNQKQNENITGGNIMEGKPHSLILVVVNQGHSDDVMETARGAGARGGTIVRSRFAGDEENEQFYGISLQAEKEIIAIVASGDNRNTIMEMINKKHGLKTEAGAVICSLGIEKSTRVG